MSKRILAINFAFDEKQVRRAIALISGEGLSDEELNRRFFNREPVTVDSDILEEEADPMCIAFVSFIIGMEEAEKEAVIQD